MTSLTRSAARTSEEAMSQSTTALLVVDVQNSFCHPDGVAVAVGRPLYEIDSVVESLVAAIDTARACGMRVVYTRQGYAADYSDQGRSASKYPISAELRKRGGCVRGTWDHGILEELKPKGNDVVIDKTRLDSFLNTTLEFVLRQLAIDTILIGGCVTNFCVETTVRSAWQRDFDVTVLADAVAAYSPEMQHRGLATMAECGFATVVPWRTALVTDT